MLSRRIHIICDVFDPNKGSEFSVPLVALDIAERIEGLDITIWTTRRGDNEAAIRDWIAIQNRKNTYTIHLIPMSRADQDGNHKSRLAFILDLLDLYRTAKSKIPTKDLVWKCGQANFILNIFFLLSSRADILGPISGFEKTSALRIQHISSRFKVYYSLYSAAISFLTPIFRFLSRKNEVRIILGATKEDCKSLASAAHTVIHHMEAPLKQLLSSRPPVNQGTRSGVIWAGAMIERKNPLMAFDILSQVVNDDPCAQCSMIGDGPLFSAVSQAHAQLPADIRQRLTLSTALPRQEFLSSLAASQVMVVTSLREVNSLQVLEAMLAEVCIVSTQVSGMKDTVRASGHLFDPTDEDAVGRASKQVAKGLKLGPTENPRTILIQALDAQANTAADIIRKEFL